MFRPSIHPTGASKPASGTGGSSATKTSPNKQVSSNNDNNNGPPSTIREIRSRTIGGSVASGSARQLLAYRRQAMSMERLNGSSTPKTTSSASMSNINNLGDNQNSSKNEKLSSPVNGSNNSISGSAASSPSRGSSSGGGGGGSSSINGGLNRTASRVSRFRSAKAVFERLSSANNSQSSLAKPDARPSGGASLRNTVASRYAAAAAARGVIGQQNLSQNSPLHQVANTSPRSRVSSNQRVAASGQKSPTASNHSPKQDQPKPQPRVITTATRRTPIITASQIASSRNAAPTATITTSGDQPSVKGAAPRAAPAKLSSAPVAASAATTAVCGSQVVGKPPPKDLIDKIVSEIVRDANKEHDADCTIQDLSNCDISGIPETLDFDKCFQDVEMMTEEEARKLLSKKSESPSLISGDNLENTSDRAKLASSGHEILVEDEKLTNEIGALNQPDDYENSRTDVAQVVDRADAAGNSLDNSQQSIAKQSTGKCKVRFSEEPATVYDTHAASDYDRRNDDIDPVAASAEYEIEKSRERDGLARGDDDDDNDTGAQSDVVMMLTGRTAGVEAVIQRFNNQSAAANMTPLMRTFEDSQVGFHNPQAAVLASHQLAAAGGDRHHESPDSSGKLCPPSP